ncbi:MAG: hypothetical protein ABSC33_13540 [Candidatus Sulfotelmatobacter sp.]|jgi:hypothetical protein
MNFLKRYKTERSLLRETALLLFLVFAILVAVDQLSIRCGLEGWQRIADDLLGGLIAASLFYLYERRMLRRFREQLLLIDLTNHHIRNALQPLMFVAFQEETAVQMRLVEECVDYIDWTLREVLPGKFQERFVDHSSGCPKIKIEPPRFSKAGVARSGPENSRPQTFFGQWLDSWKNRNAGAPDELVESRFSDRINVFPWEKNLAGFSQRRQKGSHG